LKLGLRIMAAANDSHQRKENADEYQLAKFKQGYTSFTDPDKGWQWTSNPDYKHDSWDSTIDGAWEKRTVSSTEFDKFTAFNYKKLPNKPGEYYSQDFVPIIDYEFDEEKYWENAPQAKSAEQIAAELDEPRQALEAKWAEYVEKAPLKGHVPVVPNWTPAMQLMITEVPQARKMNFELASFFQLNEKGYRKNWANTRICEMRPFQRIAWNNNNFIHDYLIRFQLQRYRMTTRPRLALFKGYIFTALATMLVDMCWAREYRRTRKWH